MTEESHKILFPETPESNRLLEIMQSQGGRSLVDFLSWLEDNNIHLMVWDENLGDDDVVEKGNWDFAPEDRELLASYYEIDLDKVQREKELVREWVSNARSSAS